jgi:hypothetical protein
VVNVVVSFMELESGSLARTELWNMPRITIFMAKFQGIAQLCKLLPTQTVKLAGRQKLVRMEGKV